MTCSLKYLIFFAGKKSSNEQFDDRFQFKPPLIFRPEMKGLVFAPDKSPFFYISPSAWVFRPV